MASRFGLVVLASLFCMGAADATQEAAPTGYWYTPDHGGIVQIAPCGADLCGDIVGVTPSPRGEMPHDVTGVPQCHLMLLRDLRHRDDGRWHGTVRNPEDGQVYDAEIWLGEDGSMRLRGYIGVPLLGQTQTWQRYAGSVRSDCRFH